VGYANGAVAVFILSCLFQGRDLAFGFIDVNLLLAVAQQGYASRIISAILKPVEAGNQNGICLTCSYISYYSTHSIVLSIL
jgi:hypothetical protein